MNAHIETVQNQLSGFLLRSDVVDGWPGLLVDGYGDRDARNKLTPAGMERLSKNVLFCLFKGIIQTVDIHQKPETLHFGVSEPDDDHPGWYKTLRDENGQEKPNVDLPL